MAEEEPKKKINIKKIALFGLGPIVLIGVGLGVGAFLFMPTQTPVEQVEELIEKKLQQAGQLPSEDGAGEESAEPEKVFKRFLPGRILVVPKLKHDVHLAPQIWRHIHAVLLAVEEEHPPVPSVHHQLAKQFPTLPSKDSLVVHAVVEKKEHVLPPLFPFPLFSLKRHQSLDRRLV